MSVFSRSSDKSKTIITRDVMGTGSPATHSELADNELYAVGSTYINTTDGTLWIKKADNSWVQV